MAVYLGTSKMKEIYLGPSKVKEIYLGTDKVYSSELYILKDGTAVNGHSFSYSRDGGSGGNAYGRTGYTEIQVDNTSPGSQYWPNTGSGIWAAACILSGKSTIHVKARYGRRSSYGTAGGTVSVHDSNGTQLASISLSSSLSTKTIDISSIAGQIASVRFTATATNYAEEGTQSSVYAYDLWAD